MAKFIIETRTPETNDRSASAWTMDGLGDPALYTFTTREEAERVAASLPGCGEDWAAAEYRVREAA